MNSEEKTIVSAPENIPKTDIIPHGYDLVSAASNVVSQQRHDPLSSFTPVIASEFPNVSSPNSNQPPVDAIHQPIVSMIIDQPPVNMVIDQPVSMIIDQSIAAKPTFTALNSTAILPPIEHQTTDVQQNIPNNAQLQAQDQAHIQAQVQTSPSSVPVPMLVPPFNNMQGLQRVQNLQNMQNLPAQQLGNALNPSLASNIAQNPALANAALNPALANAALNPALANAALNPAMANAALNPMLANAALNPALALAANAALNPMLATNPALNPMLAANLALNPMAANPALNPMLAANPALNPMAANPGLNPMAANPALNAMATNPALNPALAALNPMMANPVLNQALAAQMNPLMTAQMLQAQQLQKQINKYPSWPPPEQQQYHMFHPLGWPLDPEFPYQISNYLTPNPMTALAGLGLGSAAQQLNMASMSNPMLNPFTNPLMNNPALAMGLNPMLAQAAAAMANPTGKQFSLFVFHLPEDIDDHGLLQLFAAYGAMRSNVMRHETGRSRGFGFVHFNNRHEAQIAIDMMNGHQIGRKRLRVSFKREEPDDNVKRQQLIMQQQMLQQQQMIQAQMNSKVPNSVEGKIAKVE